MSISSNTALIFDGQVQSWVMATLALTLATQGICLCTCSTLPEFLDRCRPIDVYLVAPVLVLFRVQKIHASIISHVNRHVMIYTLMVVLVDSGALAFVTSAALLCTFVAKQNAQYIVSDAVSSLLLRQWLLGSYLSRIASFRPLWCVRPLYPSQCLD